MANPLGQQEQLVPDFLDHQELKSGSSLPPGLVVSVMTLAEASWKPDVCTVLCVLVSILSAGPPDTHTLLWPSWRALPELLLQDSSSCEIEEFGA